MAHPTKKPPADITDLFATNHCTATRGAHVADQDILDVLTCGRPDGHNGNHFDDVDGWWHGDEDERPDASILPFPTKEA